MRLTYLITALSAAVFGATSANADVMSDAATIAEHWHALQAGIKDQETPLWLRGRDDLATVAESAEEVYAQSQRIIEQAFNHSSPKELVGTQRRIEVFVSLSMGDAALREVLAEASGREDIAIVFRGVPSGMPLAAGIREVQRLVRGFDPAPTVVIDPARFRALGISDVPVMTLLSDGAVIAKARGITGIDAFLARVKSGNRRDMGRLGPVHTITEPDLITLLQERLATLDLAPKKDAAMKRYFGKVDFLPLPAAVQPRRRTVDPTVIVVRDIVDADGRVLVEAGRRINPLELHPFSGRILVFDATDRAQRNAARRLMLDGQSKTILLTTRLDRNGGWDGLKQLEDDMRAPIYLLTPEVRERFQIERTVSVVAANGNLFEVHEIPVPEENE